MRSFLLSTSQVNSSYSNLQLRYKALQSVSDVTILFINPNNDGKFKIHKPVICLLFCIGVNFGLAEEGTGINDAQEER
jgi:hypothetical protein